MLIAVNAGNSHVLLGGYEEDEQLFAASIATEPKWTRDDYACKLQQVFGLYSVPVGRIRGAVGSSVVPSMVTVLEDALRLLGVTDEMCIRDRGMSLDNGGHLTHGSPVNQSGLLYHIVPYGVDDNGYID